MVTRNADCAPNAGGGEAEQGWVDIDLGDEVLDVRHAPVTTGVQLANVGDSTDHVLSAQGMIVIFSIVGPALVDTNYFWCIPY